MSPFRFFVAVLALAAVAALAQDNTAGVHAQIGTISGVVWNDLNTNGIRDTGEPGLPGWQVAVFKGHLECGVIILDKPHCINVPSQIAETAEDGSYTLTVAELRITTPSVCLTIPPGWTATAGPGTEPRSGCVARPPPPESVVSVRVPLEGEGATTADFGVVERMVNLTSLVECPHTVVLDSEFECSLELRNAGDVIMTAMSASVGLGECFDPAPCIAGFSRGLEFVSSDPPWTDRTLQYGNPFWEPLGSGSLAPGERIVLRVMLRGTDISEPGERELFSGGASGFATFGSYIVPFETSSHDFQEITIVEFLPDSTPTAIPSATPAPAATPSPTPTSATPAPALPAAGYGPSEDNGWMVGVVLLAMGIVALGAGVSLIGLGYRKL